MQEYYDIVIIGAGPAGLNAGLHAANNGRHRSILLVDAVATWDHPMQCAEAVGRRGFEAAIAVKESWIRQTVTKACFHAPDNSIVSYADKTGGYIINRAAMQQDLAQDLIDKGVTCEFNRRVTQISAMKNFKREVEFTDGSRVHGRVVIDASGPISGLGSNDAIARKPLDLEPAILALAEGVDLPSDTVHIYLGRGLAPGGYAWAFPRGANGGANIGLLIGSEFKGKVNIRTLFNAFAACYFPSATIVKRFGGTIPCASRREVIAAPGLFKAGDAASTVNPISRAGISEALLSGGIAGDHALRMLEAATEREMQAIAQSYESEWLKKRGKKHEKLARIKNILAQVPDEDYNRATRVLEAQGPKNLAMFQIFKTALTRFPRLTWGLRHLV